MVQIGTPKDKNLPKNTTVETEGAKAPSVVKVVEEKEKKPTKVRK